MKRPLAFSLGLVVFLASLFSVLAANAQNFAFKVGYNNSNVIFSPEPFNFVTSKNGFHGGIVLKDIKVSEKMGIQPEVLYSYQGFNMGGVGSVGLHYIAVPVLAKMQMAQNVSVLLGPQVSYLANARIGIGSDLLGISNTEMFHQLDWAGVAGLEYQVSDKMAVGGRYALSMGNINKDFSISNALSFNDLVTIRNTNLQVYVTFSFQ
jgi:hypothetical protein